MTNNQFISHCVEGYITSVENRFDYVSCCKYGNYLSIGIGHWSGMYADDLLDKIDGTDKFIDIPYSKMTDDMIDELGEILNTDRAKMQQVELIKESFRSYLYLIDKVSMFDDDKCKEFALICSHIDSFTGVISFVKELKYPVDLDGVYENACKYRVSYFPAISRELLAKIYEKCKG